MLCTPLLAACNTGLCHRFYQLLTISPYVDQLNNLATLVVDIIRLTQHVQQMVDKVAQGDRANDVMSWIGGFQAYNIFKDLNAISDLMTFFEDLPNIKKELARINDIPSTIEAVFNEFYALAIDDPREVLDALAYVLAQESPNSDASILARALVQEVTSPLATYLGGMLNVQAGTVVEDAQGFVAVLNLVKGSFPPKSVSGLKLNPRLEFKPFLWTWNTWFYASADYPEFSMRCWSAFGKKCFAKIPTVKKSTKRIKVTMPNEHRPGFAFMMSLLEV
jgi:hypothetical protein